MTFLQLVKADAGCYRAGFPEDQQCLDLGPFLVSHPRESAGTQAQAQEAGPGEMGGPQRKRPMVGGQRGLYTTHGTQVYKREGPRGYEEKAGVEVAPEDHKDWGRAMEEGRHGWSPLPEVEM